MLPMMTIPMLLATTQIPRGNHRLLGQVGVWDVYTSRTTLDQAKRGCCMVQPIEGETTTTMTEKNGCVRGEVTFTAVTLTARLFQSRRGVVALLIPEETETMEVLDEAQEVFGDDRLMPLGEAL